MNHVPETIHMIAFEQSSSACGGRLAMVVGSLAFACDGCQAFINGRDAGAGDAAHSWRTMETVMFQEYVDHELVIGITGPADTSAQGMIGSVTINGQSFPTVADASWKCWQAPYGVEADTFTYSYHEGYNCWTGHGARDDSTPVEDQTAEQCQDLCSADEHCDCVVYDAGSSTCFKRQFCVLEDMATGSDTYSVFMKHDVASTAGWAGEDFEDSDWSTPADGGMYGTSSGLFSSLFDEVYAFDKTSHWIWTVDTRNPNAVYCRLAVPIGAGQACVARNAVGSGPPVDPLPYTDHMQSRVIVPTAAKDLSSGMQMSGMYCYWSGEEMAFTDCPDVHVWSGVANFDFEGAEVSDDGLQLTIPFATPYSGDPFCWVNFENVWLHHTINPRTGDVIISTAEPTEAPRPWAGIESWMQVMCQGVDDAAAPSTGWFGMPSGIVVPSANGGRENAFQFSGFYCHWDPELLSFTDNEGAGCQMSHTWGGNANFAMDSVVVNEDSLAISFLEPFDGDPFCAVSFEGVWLHHRMDSYASGVTIWIADTSETPKRWADPTVGTWMMVMCYGTSSIQPLETSSAFGQLPSHVLIPSANSDLEKAYMFSGFYCHWDGTRFDDCPDGHVWDGVANFDMEQSSADGNGLVVKFDNRFAGDPFCRVQFESVHLHHRQDTFAAGVRIYIADSSGDEKAWSDVETWMMVQCHGSSPNDACVVPPGACDCDGGRPDECGVCGGRGPAPGDTCWFGEKMRTGVIVPEANAHLDKAYQTSGLYCLWSGSSFSSCPYRGMANYPTGHGFNGTPFAPAPPPSAQIRKHRAPQLAPAFSVLHNSPTS